MNITKCCWRCPYKITALKFPLGVDAYDQIGAGQGTAALLLDIVDNCNAPSNLFIYLLYFYSFFMFAG